MSVLIEGISIVIRADRVISGFTTWENFVGWVPNKTLCSDNELVRIGFMSPIDVRAVVSDLEARGIKYLVNGLPKDLTVVDQINGLSRPCDWIEVGRMPLDGDESKIIMAARLQNSQCPHLVCPTGWKYEGSLTSNHKFIPSSEIERSFSSAFDAQSGVRTFVDHEGEKWFLGRTDRPK